MPRPKVLIKALTTKQKRAHAGLCTRCGEPRTQPGYTQTMCALCAQKQRAIAQKAALDPLHRQKRSAALKEYRKKREAARSVAQQCVLCRARLGRGANPRLCAFCVHKQKLRDAVYNQRKRDKAAGYEPGDGRHIKKWAVGGAATGKRDGGAYHFVLTVDYPTLDALQTIRQRYRETETRAGRIPQTHQLSRLVRELIVGYEPERAVAKPRKPRLFLEIKANLSLDGRCKAIIARQAALSFNGNKSAALRAMIVESQGFRKAVTPRR